MGRSCPCICMLVLYIISKTAVWILLKFFAGGEFNVKESQYFLLLLYTSSVHLVIRVFNLDIYHICWFRVLGVLLCVFWSRHSWRSWWSRRQKCLEITAAVHVQLPLKTLRTCFWDLFHWWSCLLVTSKTSCNGNALLKCWITRISEL
jgi:hypothetical protein